MKNCHFAPLCQKSEKTSEPILRKAGNRKMVKENFPKNGISVIYDKKVFSPNLPKISKIGLRHFSGIAILHLCAENQKKTIKPILGKAGNRHITTIYNNIEFD